MKTKLAKDIVRGDCCRFHPNDKLFHRVQEVTSYKQNLVFYWDCAWGEAEVGPDDLIEVEDE